ncbi:MAG: ATP-binding protein [Candidatus Latescibacterota bacterium]|jgi:signal transduction histidine kinase
MLKHTASSWKRLLLIATFIVVFLVVLVAATVLLYRKAERHLDEEMGERLKSVASGLARTVEVAVQDSLSADTLGDDLLSLLFDASIEFDLSNVVILTPGGTTIFDLGGFFEPGEPNPFIALDFSAVTQARSGIAAYTNLYQSGDVFMKSAYAPISSREGVVSGILGVEAGAGYFTQLRELSNMLVFILGACVVAVAVLGILFYRQSVALDRMQEAAIRKENLATMGRMVANIAHDIRNPLSIIKTSAQRLSRKYDTEEDVLSYISEEVDELNRILTGYLDFAGSHEPSIGAHSAQSILRRCMLVVEPEIRAGSIRLNQTMPDEDVVLAVDEKRAQQAVMNVLMNAVQAVGAGGRIDVRVESVPPYGLIAVTDDGPGIEHKELGDVTKPFYTKRAEGSGLGLTIVQSVVEEHGGRFDIKSRPGTGTQVELLFPLAG